MQMRWNLAIAEGKNTFREAGGPQAYFGAPAEASAEEGRRWLDELSDIVASEILQASPDSERAQG